ncbi:MAG: hypothetical protein WC436_06240 [Candidatus Babeliales bacterium]
MIEINLLPEELRVKKKTVKEAAKPTQWDNAIYAVPVILLIVIVIHLFLGAVSITRSRVLAGLQQTWKKLEPQRTQVLGLKSVLTAESSDAQIVQSMLVKRVRVAPKLNKLSLDLQSGIWFNSVSFDQKNLIVRASVVSLKMDEMDVINVFMESLKDDKDFSADFRNMEVGSVQRKTIGTYDVVDFVLTCSLAPKG